MVLGLRAPHWPTQVRPNCLSMGEASPRRSQTRLSPRRVAYGDWRADFVWLAAGLTAGQRKNASALSGSSATLTKSRIGPRNINIDAARASGKAALADMA